MAISVVPDSRYDENIGTNKLANGVPQRTLQDLILIITHTRWHCGRKSQRHIHNSGSICDVRFGECPQEPINALHNPHKRGPDRFGFDNAADEELATRGYAEAPPKEDAGDMSSMAIGVEPANTPNGLARQNRDVTVGNVSLTDPKFCMIGIDTRIEHSQEDPLSGIAVLLGFVYAGSITPCEITGIIRGLCRRAFIRIDLYGRWQGHLEISNEHIV